MARPGLSDMEALEVGLQEISKQFKVSGGEIYRKA